MRLPSVRFVWRSPQLLLRPKTARVAQGAVRGVSLREAKRSFRAGFVFRGCGEPLEDRGASAARSAQAGFAPPSGWTRSHADANRRRVGRACRRERRGDPSRAGASVGRIRLPRSPRQGRLREPAA